MVQQSSRQTDRKTALPLPAHCEHADRSSVRRDGPARKSRRRHGSRSNAGGARRPHDQKDYLYGSHFLPHDVLATQKSGRTFLMKLKEVGLANVKAVPRTHDVWIDTNKLRGILPRFSFSRARM
jgi:hypothetical protein